jgi:hypothetical protein
MAVPLGLPLPDVLVGGTGLDNAMAGRDHCLAEIQHGCEPPA